MYLFVYVDTQLIVLDLFKMLGTLVEQKAMELGQRTGLPKEWQSSPIPNSHHS